MNPPQIPTGAVCVACNGRRWMYVSPRRGLVAGRSGGSVEVRVREECSRCAGTGRDLSAEAA